MIDRLDEVRNGRRHAVFAFRASSSGKRRPQGSSGFVAAGDGRKPVARIVAGPGEQPRPVPGRGKGMLTVLSEDDDHLKDFAEYMS